MSRRFVVCAAVSLDGYIATPDGGVDWLFDGGDNGLTAFYQTIDTAVMGRKTHDFAVAHGMTHYEGLDNYVLSRTRKPEDCPEVTFVSGEVAALAERLRKGPPGKDVWIVGGGEVVEAFRRIGCIDALILSVHPVLLGAGIPLFREGHPPLDLELEDSTAYPDGLVSLSYARRA